jgi:iron complex outermembrane receptor protein
MPERQLGADVEAGHSETARDRALAIFRLTNAAALATGPAASPAICSTAWSIRHAARRTGGTVATGGGAACVTSAPRTDKGQDPIYQANYTIAAQNLYQPVPITSYTIGAYPTAPTTAALDSRDSGVYAIDRLTFSPHWQAVAGLRSVQYRSDQGTNHYDVSKTTPMAALIYKLNRDLSFYASSSQGLEEGETAPTGSANVGVRMAPGVSRQKELGARWRVEGGTLVQAALFDISRPGYYTNTANVFTADGEQRYRGLELSAQGKLTRQLSWQTSAQWLDPEFRHINADYNGKLPENASKQTGSAFLSYELAPGLSSQRRRVLHRPPSGQRFEPGLPWRRDAVQRRRRYATPVNNMVWQLNVDNAADKRYWAGAGTRLASGAPRLIKLSVKVDL